MKISRTVEYVFFFSLLVLTGYLVWLIFSPFLSALALSIVTVIICQPLHEKIKKYTPRQNKSVAAFITTMLVLTVVVVPLFLISTLVVNEVVNFYQDIDDGVISIQSNFTKIETVAQKIIPGFEINLTEQIKTSFQWLTGNLGAIFAGTVSTIFIFSISLIGSFYFFRDGREMLQILIKISPLPNNEDEIIFERIARAVRAVATGTVLVAIIQGTLVSVGFAIFGIERAILFGSLASVGALIPGIGTTIITVPAVIYLFFAGQTTNAIGLLIWSMVVVGLVDNLIGPYLISRGNKLHPFIVLISVLGGISLIGPIGFIIGPVIVTLFMVLLEIYNQYIVQEKKIKKANVL